MNLFISEEVLELINERGITEEDIKTVIINSEKEQTFLVDEDDNHILAKHRINNFCPYVIYEKMEDGYRIITAYSHKVNLEHEF